MSWSARAVLLGWRLVRVLPEQLVHRAGVATSDVVWLACLLPPLRRSRGLAGVRQLARNLDRARPGLRPRARRALLRAALRSHLRYWCELFLLDAWDDERRDAAVRMVDGQLLQAPADAGRPCIIAMGHSGSWDVMGAWGRPRLAPVTTVVERLEPVEVFDAFVAARARLGIEALPHSGGDPPLRTLVRRLRDGGYVPLLVDRDLGGAFVEVDLLGGRVRMASGAAALADLTGAELLALQVWYEPDPTSPSGWVVVARPHVVERPVGGTRAQRVAAMTQECADVLGAGIEAHPQDWHMLHPVFLDEEGDR